jgi:hypothetical protein
MVWLHLMQGRVHGGGGYYQKFFLRLIFHWSEFCQPFFSLLNNKIGNVWYCSQFVARSSQVCFTSSSDFSNQARNVCQNCVEH